MTDLEPQDFYVSSNTERNFIGSTDAEKKVGHPTASERDLQDARRIHVASLRLLLVFFFF